MPVLALARKRALLHTGAMRRVLLLAVLGGALAVTGAPVAGAAAPEDEIGSALQTLQSTQDRGGDVAQLAQDAQLKPPTLIIVGEVVSLALADDPPPALTFFRGRYGHLD